jgi:hypothetical protein
VFGIFTSRAMRERGRYQLQLMKTRSSSGVGMKIDLEFNIDSLRITDLDESEYDQNGSAKSSSNALIDSIKQRALVQNRGEDSGGTTSGWERASPKEGFDLGKPKITADVQSSKLRQLLNNIPTDDV